MTANQVAYWKNVETERSNRERERISQQEADTKEKTAKFERGTMLANSITGGIQNISRSIYNLATAYSNVMDTAIKDAQAGVALGLY